VKGYKELRRSNRLVLRANSESKETPTETEVYHNNSCAEIFQRMALHRFYSQFPILGFL
jgi:hypothetical protein